MKKRSTLKFLLALAIAFVLMMAFRMLAFTIYTIDGQGLEPEFVAGDRVMVNRWSYGLRTGGGGLFSYGRLMAQSVKKNDLVAFEDPADSTSSHVVIGRCLAGPGDTITIDNGRTVVPGKKTCADADYYWMQSLGKAADGSLPCGFVSEELIIGRVCVIAYSIDPASSFFSGWRKERFMIAK